MHAFIQPPILTRDPTCLFFERSHSRSGGWSYRRSRRRTLGADHSGTTGQSSRLFWNVWIVEVQSQNWQEVQNPVSEADEETPAQPAEDDVEPVGQVTCLQCFCPTFCLQIPGLIRNLPNSYEAAINPLNTTPFDVERTCTEPWLMCSWFFDTDFIGQVLTIHLTSMISRRCSKDWWCLLIAIAVGAGPARNTWRCHPSVS